MTPDEIKTILDNHTLWLRGDPAGQRADLVGAKLYGANLSGANLQCANLQGADLHGADLHGANLHGAGLSDANLHGAKLYGADLSSADLYGANLYGADLSSANLVGANLVGAKLYGADLSSANLVGANLVGADLHGADLSSANLVGANLVGTKHDSNTIWGPRQTLPAGTLMLWKKVHSSSNSRIALLRVPADADRTSSYVGRKVRCSFAWVERLENLDGTHATETECVSGHRSDCVYRVGEMVVPDSWDPNPLIECTHGIHAFVTREEAVAY